MSLLTRVRQQFNSFAKPKDLAASHPDLAGREHVYSGFAGAVEQQMASYVDYAVVYSVYVWVHKAISLLANNLASLPVRVVDGNGKEVANHPLTLLLERVNDEDAPAKLWRSYVINMMLGGETFYQFVMDGRGRPAEIWMRRPDQIGVVPDATRLDYPTAIAYQYRSADNRTFEIPANEMAHDQFFNPLSPWRGLAPIAAVRQGITIDLLAQAWSRNFYKMSARPDFALIVPQGLSASEQDRYYAEFMRGHQGVDKAYLPIILEDGITDIKVFSFPPKDIEWLQQRELSRDEVGAIFGVPDEIMGYGKDTYENFNTAIEVLWTLTILPLVRNRDTTLTRHFEKYGYGLLPGQRIETDLSKVGALQEDITPKVELARKFWDMGVPFNTLDKTFGLGIGPIDGGDTGFVSSSLTTVDLAVEPPLPPGNPLGAVAPPTPPANDNPPKEPPPAKIYVLPDGAKEGAKRTLKKMIQGVQDSHLRALRGDSFFGKIDSLDDTELRRWTGNSEATIDALLHSMSLIEGSHDTVNAAYNALKSDEQLSRLLEVEATTAFFIPDAITPAWYKAMVLQLSPDDDEAEQQARMGIERKFSRELSGALDEQMNTLLPDDATDDQVQAAPAHVTATSEPVREVLRRHLLLGSDLGVTVAFDQFQNIGMAFDWLLPHDKAAKWASSYSYDLIRGMNATTQSRMQTAVSDWFKERTTLDDLKRELEPLFGKRRAQTIAQTETTRAAHEGSVLGYEESGVVSESEWVTVADERVCNICGPLDGKRAPLRGEFEGGVTVPAHVNCRCFVRPVVES